MKEGDDMSERTIQDFPAGTRVVRTAHPNAAHWDVPVGTRGDGWYGKIMGLLLNGVEATRRFAEAP